MTTRSQGSPTNVSDKDYNVISVLYHALQGAETALKYEQDARQEGDNEIADFLRKVCDDYNKVADEAKGILADRIKQTA